MAALMVSLPSSHSCYRAPCPFSSSSVSSASAASIAFPFQRSSEKRSFRHAPTRKAASSRPSVWNLSIANTSNTAESGPPLVEMEAIPDEDHFNSALSAAQERSKPIVIDWMASWCRKCIYLQPKLTKLATEFQSDVKFYYVDVNTVPQALVKRAEVTKMPTIQVWKNGEKCGEVIGGQKPWVVIDEVRDMVQKNLR